MTKLNYAQRAVRGLSLVFITGLFVSFLAYLLRVGLAHTLSLADFGLFYAVLTVILLFLTFRDIGLRNASVKYIAHYMAKKAYGSVKSVILISVTIQGALSLLLTLLFFFSAPLLAQHYFHIASAELLVRVLSILFISNFLFMNSRSILRGFQNMKWFSVADPVRIITIIGTFLVLYLNGFTILGAAIAYIAGDIMAFLVILFPLNKYLYIFRQSATNLRETTREMISYSLPVMFTGVGEKILGYVDVVLLTTLASIEAVGIYNVVLPTALFFLALTSATTTIVFPLISELWSKKDHTRIYHGMDILYRYILAVAVPAILVITVFAELFLRLLFGAEFVAGTLAFQILLGGVIFFVIAKINYAALSAVDNPGTVTKITLITGGLNIILNLILIPMFGIVGAAIATTSSFVFTFILSSVSISQKVKMKLPVTKWVFTLISSIVFVAIVAYVKHLLQLWWPFEFVISVIPAGVIYLAIIFVLRVVSIREFKEFTTHLLPK